MPLTTSGHLRRPCRRTGPPVARLGPSTITTVLRLLGRILDNLRGAAFRPHLLPREPIRLRATGRARSRPTLRGERQARHPLAVRRISAVAIGITAITALTTESQSRDGPSSKCSVSVRLPASW